jgi:hypothetical protein
MRTTSVYVTIFVMPRFPFLSQHYRSPVVPFLYSVYVVSQFVLSIWGTPETQLLFTSKTSYGNMKMTRYEYNGFVVLYMCRTKDFSATSYHNAKRWTRSSLTANSRTKRWPSACRREIASRICGAYPVLDRGNEETTAFQVSSSVSQLDDLHKASKTLAGVSIAITGMPDRTAEWIRKLISNAVHQKT